ncbi:MAG: phosphopantothenoylcysteine decarboxylase [Anaerolineae bacterium]
MRDLAGIRILITSGGTRGPIDAVRYIANKSTGRLGMLMASEALSRGADVTFVYGKDSLVPDAEVVGEEALSRLKLREIETIDELQAVMKQELQSNPFDAVLHCMAVLDYVPETYVEEKTPSGQKEWWIKLVRTPKVIKIIKELQPSSLLISFKLEVGKSREELVDAAYRSLVANGADLVLANDLRQIEQGRHVGYLVNRAGEVEAVAEGKEEIAQSLLDVVAMRAKAHAG